ncbi:MAG: metallophosphoesterase [Kiritimatiellae bacterium]|nr:metallophosphoesterase [Kiritimatiellia bacterium]
MTNCSPAKPLELRRITIDVGASAPFTALMVADVHLPLADARDDERKRALAAGREKEFHHAAHYLDEAVQRARTKHVPILLAGDLWDFTSAANFDAGRRLFGKADWFGCVGNHEFSQYVGEAREDAAYKAVTAARMAEVWPNDIVFASRVVNGVNFVALDDVYYNFTESQLARMKDEVAKGLPIVVICHTPLYVPGHYAHEMGKNGGVCSYQVGVPDALVATWRKERDFPPGEEWRDRRVQQRADAPTREFIEYLKAQPLLRAVLAGHNHGFWRERLTPTTEQIVCPGLFSGEALLLEFR